MTALYTAPKRGCGQGRGPLMSSAGRSGRHDRRHSQRLVWPARRRTASPPATFAGIGRTGACAATVIEVPARRSAALPFAAVGAACIVAGGLVAAVSAPAPSEHASWAAAYLVLVVGAAAQEACSDGAGALTAATSPPATMQAAPTAAKGSAAERRAGTSITVAAQAPVRPMPANVAGGMPSPTRWPNQALRMPTVMAAAPAGRTQERPFPCPQPRPGSIKGRYAPNYGATGGSGTGPGNPAPMRRCHRSLPTTVLPHRKSLPTTAAEGRHLDEHPAAQGYGGQRPGARQGGVPPRLWWVRTC